MLKLYKVLEFLQIEVILVLQEFEV